MRTFTDWNFIGYLLMLSSTSVLLLAGVTLIPDKSGGGVVDLREFFHRTHRRSMFFQVTIGVLNVIFNWYFLNQSLLHEVNVFNTLTATAPAVAAMVATRKWIHILAVLVTLTGDAVYVILYAFTLRS